MLAKLYGFEVCSITSLRCTKSLIQSYSKLTQDKPSNMKAGEKIRSDTEVVAVI